MSDRDRTELGRTLWAIADDLRGAMNADDFRDYMLSLLAVIRKRSFLDIGRERLAGLVQLEADTVGYGCELLLG
jgi:type I restriction-modification system DNA methylase subunit